MIAALTALLVAPQVHVAPPTVQEPVATSAVLHRTDTQLTYRNASTSRHVLIFGSYRSGTVATLSVAPGAEVAFPFTAYAHTDLLLEVIQVDATGLFSSGSIWLESLDQADDGMLIVTQSGDGLAVWATSGGEMLLGATSGPLSLYAQGGGESTPTTIQYTGGPEYAHVPVITPRPAGENTPVQRKPLPPA